MQALALLTAFNTHRRQITVAKQRFNSITLYFLFETEDFQICAYYTTNGTFTTPSQLNELPKLDLTGNFYKQKCTLIFTTRN